MIEMTGEDPQPDQEQSEEQVQEVALEDLDIEQLRELVQQYQFALMQGNNQQPEGITYLEIERKNWGTFKLQAPGTPADELAETARRFLDGEKIKTVKSPENHTFI